MKHQQGHRTSWRKIIPISSRVLIRGSSAPSLRPSFPSVKIPHTTSAFRLFSQHSVAPSPAVAVLLRSALYGTQDINEKWQHDLRGIMEGRDSTESLSTE